MITGFAISGKSRDVFEQIRLWAVLEWLLQGEGRP